MATSHIFSTAPPARPYAHTLDNMAWVLRGENNLLIFLIYNSKEVLSFSTINDFNLHCSQKKEAVWLPVPHHTTLSAAPPATLDNLAWVFGGDNNLLIDVAV